MKFTYKRLLSLAVVLVMVLSMLPATSLAAGTACPLCGGTSWTEITDLASITQTGECNHYRVKQEITRSAYYSVTGNVVIDLAGQRIGTDDNVRIFGVEGSGKLTIMDSVGGGIVDGGNVSTNTNNNHGGTVLVGSSATFNLYGGTIQGGTANQGGNIRSSGTVNIHGGSVKNGKATSVGGNIAMSSGTLNIYGGSIYQSSTSTTVKTSANIAVVAGIANVYGGNIKCDMTDAKSIRVWPSRTFNIYGGAFAGGIDWQVDGTLNIYAGTIAPLNPTSYAKSEGTYKACIYATDTNYVVWQPDLANFTNATLKAAITNPANAQHTGNPCESCGYSEGAVVPPAGNTITGNCAACTGEQTWYEYTPGMTIESGKHYYFSEETTLTAAIAVTEGQKYCFELNGQNVTAAANAKAFDNAGTLHVQDSVKTGFIKGYGSTAGSNGGLIGSNGTLTLKDVTLKDCETTYNGGILAITGGTATVNGGAIENGESTGQHGGNVYIKTSSASATFTGVTISGGKVSSAKMGGNVYVTEGASAEFTNCTFTGGEALRGGSVAATSANTTVTLNNCSVTGGSATEAGENVLARGGATVTLNNGCFVDGGATATTDIYNQTEGVLNIKAGVTTYWNPTTWMDGCTGILSAKDNAGKNYFVTYADFNAAYAALAAGKAIRLTQNETVGDIELAEGEAINLYGFTLTADSLDTLQGGTIVDGQGGGKVVTNALAAGNAQLPITVGENEYVFEEVEVAHRLANESANVATYKFYFSKNDADTYLKEAIAAGTASVKILINYEGLTEALKYTIDAADLQEYAADWDNNMFTLTITGVEGKTGLTCGVEVSSNNADYAITPATVAQ